MAENSTDKNKLSADDLKQLQSYIYHIDLLTESEPEYIMTDPESADDWNAWNGKIAALNEKYHDIIVKALTAQLSEMDINDDTQSVVEILRFLLPAGNPPAVPQKGLLSESFLPLWNNVFTNEFTRIDTRNFQIDTITDTASYTADKVKFEIKNFSNMRGSVGSSAKKLLDTAIAYLTNNNYRNTMERAKVKIPFIEYGESRGRQLTPRQMKTNAEQTKENRRNRERIKDFRDSVHRDLDNIKLVSYTVTETSGPNKGEYIDQGIISSHRIVRENGELMIEINFDIDAAKYLSKSLITQYPTILLKLDDRNPNAYPIGKKIAAQNSNDHNAVKGTANTLKVKTLLAAADEIPTIENLRANKQRNWKDKIKKPLESAINENMRVGYVIRWEYRNPKSNKTYSSDQANALSWDDWYNLDIDFVLMDNPKQDKRREKIAAEKEKALNPAADDQAGNDPPADKEKTDQGGNKVGTPGQFRGVTWSEHPE